MLFLIFAGTRTEQTVAYVNGHIITMDSYNPNAQAMVVYKGRISELGSSSAIRDKITASVRVVDLKGRTVLPGFVDAHSHFPASGIRAVSVDLSPPPTGTTDTMQGLLDQVAQAVVDRTKSDWLLGYNYDNTALLNGEHPTRKQLDVVAPDHPVYLWHNSGHMGVANSRALTLLSVNENTVAPAGGVIGRDAQTGLLNGLLQETAAPPLASIVGKFSIRKQWRVLTAARENYLANGVTTIQNGYAGLNMMRLLEVTQKLNLIPQRIVVWPAEGKKNISSQFANKLHDDSQLKGDSEFNFKVGAIKILVDGSPQGFTAYLSEPYFNTRDKPANYRGFALIDQQALTKLVTRYHKNGYQLALHGNGDDAIETIINAVESAQNTELRVDARHIIVHAQTIRKDQLARLKALSLTPSFFVSHTYYWGDWHRQESLGPIRAANISPTQWAGDFGLRYSLHSDAPVTPMNPMQLLWSATNRKTISDHELGPDQRIDMNTALRAVTIDAAWQNHVEDSVGSLEIGKLADMVVLSQDPHTADDVRKIQVLTTYIGGVEHYSIPDGVRKD